MNWDAIAALSELLAAIGVVVSLLYLALQVRQNTDHVRLNSESLGMAHEMGGAQMAVDISMALASDPEFSDLVRRAIRGEGELTPVERFRFASYMLGSVTVFQAGHYNYRRGFADSEAWSGHERQMMRMMSSPAARAWWVRAGPQFSAPFAEYMDGLLGSDASGGES